MRRTNETVGGPSHRMAVTTESLMEYLDCGRVTAIKVGELAKARIQIGRRVLWNVDLISQYLETTASGKE